jgi:protocatechuate 3,4-dioxygenase, alpha subunit
MPGLTPWQTLGPFFHGALPFEKGPILAGGGPGVIIEGTMRDGAGAPVADGLVETWQADAAGRYADPAFDGFGRAATDGEGRFALQTVKPGAVAGPDGRLQAPHLVMGVLARGLLTRLVTRLYFEDEANAQDPILALVPPARRPTLIARRAAEGRYRFDIVLQGDGETVFFDV